jgi:hypothetical protein
MRYRIAPLTKTIGTVVVAAFTMLKLSPTITASCWRIKSTARQLIRLIAR